jgi:hypothetical protein
MKYGCIGFLSAATIPLGLFEPTVCKANKCIAANAAKTKGNKKCNAKNLFNVALETEKPPQINSTKL